MGRNCFGSPGPARSPAPAATMTTPTSGSEAPRELTNVLQSDDVQSLDPHARPGRQERAAESLTGGLGQPAFDAGDGADLAAQSHLPEEDRVGGCGAIVNARDQSRGDREIGGRLEQPNASGHVYEHIQVREWKSPAALEHRQEYGQATLIESGGDPLGRAEACLRGERLDFDRSEEHTSELQSHVNLVCRLLLEKKKKKT